MPGTHPAWIRDALLGPAASAAGTEGPLGSSLASPACSGSISCMSQLWLLLLLRLCLRYKHPAAASLPGMELLLYC